MYLSLLMSHCLSVSLVNRQRPLIQTAYRYCVLAVKRISQIFPHLDTQEVNNKQHQCTQEVGFEPMKKGSSNGEGPILSEDKVNRWQTCSVLPPVNLSTLTTSAHSSHPLIFIHYRPQLEAWGVIRCLRPAELQE